MRFLRLLPVVLALFSCGGGNSKDPLKDLTARVDLYVDNTPTTYPTEMPLLTRVSSNLVILLL